jgi:hypothetical protein
MQMKYESVVVDQEKGIVRITTQDERYYRKVEKGQEVWIPSVTWICSYFPKGEGFENYLLSHTKEEAKALLEEAGERGSVIHKACEMVLLGKQVRYDTEIEL